MRLKLLTKKTLLFFVLLFLLVTSSCSHNLEIINLGTYKNKNLNMLEKNVTIGIFMISINSGELNFIPAKIL